MTEEQLPPPMPKGSEGVAIVGILLQQMESMKGDILSKIDENAKAAVRRWQSHEDEHHNLEQGLKELRQQFDEHMRKERDADLIFDARVAPLKRVGLLVAREWRTIALGGLIIANFVDRALLS